MAIPNRQIGWSQKSNLLWEISKQLERLTEVIGKNIVNTTTTTTTTAGPVNWQFLPSGELSFPTDQTGYTLYEGGFTQFDDGQTISSSPIGVGGNFHSNNVADTSFYLSTNGFIIGNTSSFNYFGNSQDLYLTPGNPLIDGDIQNLWYYSQGTSTIWKTSVLVYCGLCCSEFAQGQPNSYILNLYRDENYQYMESRLKIPVLNIGGVGPSTAPYSVDTLSQVWRSDLDGITWSYLGFGSIV